MNKEIAAVCGGSGVSSGSRDQDCKGLDFKI